MKSVFLRAFEKEDFYLINKWRNSRNIQQLTCGHFRFVSSEMERNWVQEKMLNNTRDVYLSICRNDSSQRMIGYTSINDINHLDRKARGGGIVIHDDEEPTGEYLIDASLLKLQHVFDDLNLHRYTGSCLEEHTSSRLMMEMLGYKYEGCERDAIYKNGRFHNVLHFSLLSTEYYKMLNNDEYSVSAIRKRLLSARRNLKNNKPL